LHPSSGADLDQDHQSREGPRRPQDRELGDLQRDIEREQAAMNDAIAAITQQHQPRLADLKEAEKAQMSAIQAWCEANRQVLTDGGKTKTVNMVTGEVAWRLRPPSVTLRMMDKIIEQLKAKRLAKRFLRIKEEVDKEAILKDPKAVDSVVGITINTGQEDFVVKPFAQEAA
jgi:phage host-nuclease inhibitor protein Gam